MKKTAVILIAAALSVFCLVPALAADTRGISEYAKSVYTLSEGCYTAEEEDAHTPPSCPRMSPSR